MTKRAIILIPGFKKREHLAARDLLVEAIAHYGSGYRVDQTDTVAIGGLTPAAMQVHNRQDDTQTTQLHIFEAFWGDLIPDWTNESPWARFKRGLYLIWFWVAGGFLRAMLRFEIPTRTVFAMMIAAIMLIAWYMTVVTVLLQTLGSADTGLPAQVQELITTFPVLGQALSFVENLQSIPLVLFVMGLATLGGVEKLANMSSFVKDYLRDEPFDDAQVGLRAKARARVTCLLDHVTRPDAGYDDVHVVAHSLGGAIAVDALADYGQALPRVTLHTWGSGLGLLVQQANWVEEKIATLYEHDTSLEQWIDVVFPKDVMASPRPLPRDTHHSGWRNKRHEERFTPTLTPARTRSAPFAYSETHEGYFRCEAAIKRLLEPAPPQKPSSQTRPADVTELKLKGEAT